MKNIILASFFLFAVAFLFAGTISAIETGTPLSFLKYPNIVLILADDMGYGDVSLLNENSKIKTPNLDSLGKEGIVFTDAHAACSVCGPSRYGVLTGRYPMRNRMLSSNNPNGFGAPVIEKERLTIAQILKNKGYDTAAFGKWHLGMTWATKDGKPITDITSPEEWQRVDYTKPITEGPNSAGFDYYFGIAASLDMVPYVFIENDHPTEIPSVIKQNDPPRPGPAGEKFEPVEVLPALTKKAVEYIGEHGTAGKKHGTPFFVYMPLNAPHTPLVPAKEWQGKNQLGNYGDYVLQVDDTVGQVLAAIDKNGLKEDTLVIFTVDNGFAPYIKPEKYEALGHFPSYIYRGYKGDIYDGGHRLPFLVRWTGKTKPGISNALVCLTDFAKTFADITGYELPDNAAEDSISFLPVLFGKNNPQKRTNAVHLSPKNRISYREENLKLVVSATTNPKQQGKNIRRQLPELYDMTNDPQEKHNLAEEHPETVQRLFEKLKAQYENGRSTSGRQQKNDTELNLQIVSEERINK